MNRIKCYFLGKAFPAVSVTANRCALRCPHCMGQPLSNMLSAETPSKLMEIATQLKKERAIGFLLSGGCNEKGVLPIGRYLETIRQIKDTTNLRINSHIGFPRFSEAKQFVKAGIDVFSVNYPLNDRFGKEFFFVPDAMMRYQETVESLSEAGAKTIIPHVIIGLAHSDDEMAGLRRLIESSPQAIVFIAFSPLRGTPLEKRAPTSAEHIIRSIRAVRQLSKNTKIVLGCMRPRGYAEMERLLMTELLDGIVMPNMSVLRSLEGKMNIERLDGCCSLYL